jgi:hypothetical protein
MKWFCFEEGAVEVEYVEKQNWAGNADSGKNEVKKKNWCPNACDIGLSIDASRLSSARSSCPGFREKFNAALQTFPWNRFLRKLVNCSPAYNSAI